MNGVTELESDDPEYVEVDPTGRYGRYNEVLGKGASKTVYRAFDEYEGIEVAWNQVKLYDFLQSPEDLERLYCEIHLLKTLKHNSIMKFYTSWVDTANRNINFVTEMFTSGTLRQYRLKHKKVNIRAVKHWCRQILQGLHYLHSHDPPIIHRDLKCDNIFINGNQGEVKIGDLGLAAILRKSHAARCVGTPEFMAPEVYAEEYNELVDIYSFGMCILEMVTFEYPYSECNHPAQIYKKVTSGKKPDALYKVKDPEVCRFIEKCLATVSHRLSARELLNDPFLQTDGYFPDLRPLDYYGEFYVAKPMMQVHHSNDPLLNGYSNYLGPEQDNEYDHHSVEYEVDEIDLFPDQDDDHLEDVDIMIKGRRREDDNIFLRLRIADKEGRIRNIYFPFDIESDTALSVATEMVAELDITDQDVTKIAEMIDGEIASLVPEWQKGFVIEESPNHGSSTSCQNCASDGSLVNYLSSNALGKNLQVLQSSKHGCGGVHGRFEEITYQFEGHEQCKCNTEGAPASSSQTDNVRYTDIWAQHEGPELGSQYSGDEHEYIDESIHDKDEKCTNNDEENTSDMRRSHRRNPSTASAPPENYENEIRQEMRWLKAKYQRQLRQIADQQLGVVSKSSPSIAKLEGNKFSSLPPVPFASGNTKNFSKVAPIVDEKSHYSSCSPVHMITAKSFYSSSLLPNSLNRATSLPVDAIDF